MVGEYGLYGDRLCLNNIAIDRTANLVLPTGGGGIASTPVVEGNLREGSFGNSPL